MNRIIQLTAALVCAALMAGCAGTRAAYKAAFSKDGTLQDQALVVTEHYAAVIKEAADYRERPGASQRVVNALRVAANTTAPTIIGDPNANPPKPSLAYLVDAYERYQTSQSKADLQNAVNSAIQAVADLIRALKDARSESVSMEKPLELAVQS